MDVFSAQSITAFVPVPAPPPPRSIEQFQAADMQIATLPPGGADRNTVGTAGEASAMQLEAPPLTPPPPADPLPPAPKPLSIEDPATREQFIREMAALGQGEDVSEPQVMEVASKYNFSLDSSEADYAKFARYLARGESLEEAMRAKYARASDPLVFDLNRDGDTDATVDQRGLEVDGSTATKWAERGDGVLALGGNAIDTVDSQGFKHHDAYETLKAEASYLGIIISKGYLDADDLRLLEANGLRMLVSNGDGTNDSVPPTELGITRMSLGGKAVDKTDAVGNRITTEGSFVRNGESLLVHDMWLNNLD